MSSNKNKLSEALSGIEELYTRNLKTHGLASKSVGWKDETEQRLRFEKLVQVVNPDNASQGITVNDYGCGYGAMFQYLDAVPSLKLNKYYGYDISSSAVCGGPQGGIRPWPSNHPWGRLFVRVGYVQCQTGRQRRALDRPCEGGASYLSREFEAGICV